MSEPSISEANQREFARFAEALQANPELGEHYRGIDSAVQLAARMRADGFDVTDEAVAHYVATLPASAGLTDQQLDGVSGAGFWSPRHAWRSPLPNID